MSSGVTWSSKRTYRLVVALASVVALLLAQDLAGGWLETLLLYLPGIDKVLHTLEFFAIFVLVHWVAGPWTNGSARRLAVAAGTTLLLAVGDEGQQGLSATRSVELNDLLADACGLTLGAVAVSKGRGATLRLVLALMVLSAVIALTYDTYAARKDFNLAQRYERQGQFALARQSYQRALRSGLATAGLFNGLAWVEVESEEGSADKAVEYGARALALRPGDPDILDTYGWALVNAGRPAEALAPLLEAQDKKPEMFCIHYHLGKAYLAIGDRGQAEAHFRKQREAAPGADESRRATLELERLRLKG